MEDKGKVYVSRYRKEIYIEIHLNKNGRKDKGGTED
jgi:hypothetical protein